MQMAGTSHSSTCTVLLSKYLSFELWQSSTFSHLSNILVRISSLDCVVFPLHVTLLMSGCITWNRYWHYELIKIVYSVSVVLRISIFAQTVFVMNVNEFLSW